MKVKDITELSVNASTNDPNAKVKITDNYRKLQKGENKIEIKFIFTTHIIKIFLLI